MGKISNFIKKAIYQFKPKKNLDKIILEKKNLDDLFNYFESDKGSVILKKYPGHEYGRFYEKHLSKYRNKDLNILEIGTYYGGSVAAFYFYFKNANIFCIDKNFKFKFKSSRVKFFNCNTSNESDLSSFKEFIKKENCKKFDLIIDDGSHLLSDIKKNFLFFFNLLNSGGYYVIEDFNQPKYYEGANDLKNNEQLIDDLLVSLKNKRNFNSQIFNFNSNNKIFNEISKIDTYKGNMKLTKEMMIAQDGLISEKKISQLLNKNVSDIAFIQKK